jgi:hypothetical protein
LTDHIGRFGTRPHDFGGEPDIVGEIIMRGAKCQKPFQRRAETCRFTANIQHKRVS